MKNNDEVNHICLDSIDTKLALEHWLEYKLRLSQVEYATYATEPPRDEQTILRDTTRFEKTSFRVQGRIIYCELATGRYWYVDNLHFGEAAHLEVFDKTGNNHLGEADLDGTIDNLKRDANKTITLS
ncbi:hypothetical protein ICL16_22765 [Iningainema sp. BLCCT55]|uniref:Uncharacterized protein n=1 Tax=Iningainema tapete BLCC-T55 TaxID=2748662 RepID=A0A8J7BYY1_9CYAN|nr:hypothetical protein [Iningainema tapete BLCC-T55]